MKFDIRGPKGELQGHIEVTDADVAAHKVLVHKVRGDAERKEGHVPETPEGMTLVSFEKGARDEFGEHDLYLFAEAGAFTLEPVKTAAAKVAAPAATAPAKEPDKK